ncbi:MAG: fibronectin type III domain-containing protein [Spirochaetaceae bacterium]
MKKKLTLLINLLFFTISLFSESTTVIGDNTNFTGFTLDYLEVVKGERGKTFLEMSPYEYERTPETDFLVHFNSDLFTEEMGNYKIKSHYHNITNVKKKLGNASSYFLENRGIIFSSLGDSLFSPGRVLSDFTIEFWVYPTLITEDTTIFSWKGVNKIDDEFIPQKIKFYFEDRKAIWDFSNFFVPDDFSKYSIKLQSKSRLIPKRWSHHLIRYKSDSGMLEYLINGVPEDIKHTSKTQKEDMTVYPPFVGNFSKSDLYIGERFNGFIDEFRISEKFIENIQLSKYKPLGTFSTPVLDINGTKVIIDDIQFQEILAPETTIKYKLRISDTPFLKTNANISWISPDTLKRGTKARYIQIKGEMYGDGSNSVSPLLENINIYWDTIPKPPRPLGLTSIPEKNGIKLLWNPVKHSNIDGYTIYLGLKSNNYIEMIDVGKNTSYTIKNLQSNKIYYFSVRSYVDDLKSDYSQEKYNRPK